MIFISLFFFFFFKQKTAYEIYQCDWSSDVCSSDLFVNYARLLLVANRKQEALDILHDAVNRGVATATIYAALGSIYFESGATTQAKTYLEKAAYMDKNDVKTWMSLAELCYRINDKECALNAYQHIQSLQPGIPQVLQRIAELNRTE